jgi:hypothetical protein
MIKVFEADLQHATPYTLEMWRHRSLRERLEEMIVRPIRALL